MINGRTQLIGLIGWPISHSFSPAMHNAAAAAAGLNVVYVPLPVRPEDVATAVTALGFRGGNVTIPHKQAVMPLLPGLTDSRVRFLQVAIRNHQISLFGMTDFAAVKEKVATAVTGQSESYLAK